MRLNAKVLALVMAALAVGALAEASGPPPTTITVEGMHCQGCAKKIANRLQAVPGVAAIQADVPAARLTVSAKSQQAPSPRALWEAVERAGYKPTKLDGPAGSFTARPER